MIRTALLLIAAMIFSPCAPGSAGEDSLPERRVSTTFPAGDGRIVLYGYQLNELLETTYRRGDRYVPEGIAQIVEVFRCRSDGKRHAIDLRLIELLDHLQDRFNADSIEFISGYRSPALNGEIRKRGGDVAEESMHMEGRAADIHIDEVTEELVARYVRGLGFGGVGYYPALDFVHIDTGDVRNWDLPDRPGRLLVAMRKGAVWQITTDRDLYLPGETIPYEILNTSRTPKTLAESPRLEIFRRGKWKAVRLLEAPGNTPLGAGETWAGRWNPSPGERFGKYRIVVPGPEGFEYLDSRSNEFYRKSG